MDGGATEFTGGGTIEDLGRLEGLWSTSGIALWSIVLFGAVLLNSTLLLAFLKRPGLRTISNRFVMNLTVSNLLTCCILTPLLMLDTRGTVNLCICSVAEGATAIVTTSSVFSVLLIAVDQYLAVVDPLRYRTRIDTLKCGILVISVWMISLVFGLFAALNPNPRSLWLICQRDDASQSKNPADLTINSSLFVVNSTQELSVFPFEIEERLRLIENTTEVIEETILEFEDKSSLHITYGLIYAITYSLLAYLLPFVGVCWIYVSIYSAAHKNSERTRRTGSRPILSSGSFSEEYYPVRQDVSTEDFRRIPKISSLSSIDESTETSPSQLPRRFSEHCNQPSPIQEEPSTVIFTVGSQDVDVPQTSGDTTKETISKVPVSVLKAEFLGKKSERKIDTIVKSKFTDENEQKRKSSHDLMYEEMLRRDLEILRLRRSSSDSDTSDDADVVQNFEHTGSDHSAMKREKNTDRGDLGDSEPDRRDSTDGGLYPPLMPRYDSMEIHKSESDDSGRTRTTSDSQFVKNKHVKNLKLKTDINGDDICRKYSIGNLESTGLFGNNTPIVTITPPHRASLHRVCSTRSTCSYINSLKYRISNGSLFKYREETRAARVSAFVIVMGLICWTPYVVVLMLRNLPVYSWQNFSHATDIVALSFFILAAYVSPLLFGYRSRRVKRELRKFFCFRKELSYKANRSLMAKKVLKRRHSGNLSNFEMDNRYNIFNCVYGKNKWPKEKVQFVQVPETALVVETCRSSFSSGASTQISSTSTDEC